MSDLALRETTIDQRSNDAIKIAALKALRDGDYQFGIDALGRHDLTIEKLVEDLRIYQAELEVQNDELRQSQVNSEIALLRFSALFGDLPLPAVVIDELGMVHDSNHLAQQQFGLDRNRFHAHSFPRFISKDYYARFRGAISDAGAKGCGVACKLPMRSADGSEFIADIYVSILPSADHQSARFAAIVVDQSALLKHQEALEASQRHFMAYFRSAPVGMAALSSGGRWLEVNDRLCELFGYSREELLLLTWQELSHSEDAAIEAEKVGWVLAGKADEYSLDKRYLCKDGSVLDAHAAISAVRKLDGVVDYFVATIQSLEERKRAESRIQHIATHDPLTELPNRTLLRDRFDRLIANARRSGNSVALLYLDLDHFKNINDSLGHPVGDRLLIEASRRISSCVREADTVSRLGGDEFVVALGDIRTAENVAEVCDKILYSLSRPYDIESRTLSLSCSIGACLYPADGEDFDQVMQNADTSVYQAKAGGRNRFSFFTEEMNRQVTRRMVLENEMREGLCQNQFFLAYQPQFDIRTGEIVGAEALLRWESPRLGSVSPAEFIPIAEANGFIVDLGQFVIHETCRQGRLWLDQGRHIRLAVNVSYVQFLRSGLAQSILESLEAAALPGSLLELELTESVLASNPGRVMDVFQAVAKAGVRCAIDDFGTGFSSLSYLRRFSADKLKIDQSFVRDVPGDSEDEIIVSAIITLAHNLRMECIAEGVETQEQLEFLKRLGCDQIQGYLLARPLSASALTAMLAAKPPATSLVVHLTTS